MMGLFNCGVVCFVGESLSLAPGTCYNPLIQTPLAICRLNWILGTCELGVACAMCFVVIVVIFHLVWAVYR